MKENKTETDILNSFIRNYLRGVHTIKPAKVTGVTGNRVKAQILTTTKYVSGKVEVFPDVVDVPLMIYSGTNGTFRITTPVAKGDNRAMGATNDCILYGGRTFYFIRPDEDDDLAALTEKAPSSASSQYGMPFYKLFKSVEFDFYKVDPHLFSPAEITINDVIGGKTYRAGKLNPDVLKQSFKME